MVREEMAQSEEVDLLRFNAADCFRYAPLHNDQLACQQKSPRQAAVQNS